LDRGPLDGAGRARGGSPRQRIVLTYGFHRLTIIAARVERPCAHDVAREMRAGIRQLDRDRTCLLGVLGRAVEVAERRETISEPTVDSAKPPTVSEASRQRFRLAKAVKASPELTQPHQRRLRVQNRVDDALGPP